MRFLTPLKPTFRYLDKSLSPQCKKKRNTKMSSLRPKMLTKQGRTGLKISTGKQFIKGPGLAFVGKHWLLATFKSSRLPICHDNIFKDKMQQ